jgi:hypothetical protein
MEQMLFTICHGVILLAFAVTVVFTAITVFELRNTTATYNARLFTFGYFSLGAWIFWILQYALLAAPFLSFPTGLPLDIVLSLSVIQNSFWTSAVLSLRFEQLSRKSLTLPALGIFSLVVGLVAYQTTILLTAEQFTQFIGLIDGIWTAIIFIVLGTWIVQLHHSKIYAVVLLIHGFTQWIWTWRWLTSFGTSPIVQLAFPFWRIALLIVWIRLISEMAQRAQPSEKKITPPPDQKPGGNKERAELSSLLVPIRVMISSTVTDLVQEREAVDRAIRGLHLDRFRAETFGSVSHAPEVICAFMAEQCDIFVLIIGERYGYRIESIGMSVVEFEYGVARNENPKKILVYVKEDVDREPELIPFLERVEHFQKGLFRTLFTTPDDLRDKVQADIARWLVSHVKQNRRKEA